MGALDRFEKSVERMMNNAFAKVGRGEVKPVELASRLRRELDDRAAVVGRDRTVAPNEFTIELAPDDFAQIEAWGAQTLADELASNITAYAATQHYAFVGPVSVTFDEQYELVPGRFTVRSRERAGKRRSGDLRRTDRPAPAHRHRRSALPAHRTRDRDRARRRGGHRGGRPGCVPASPRDPGDTGRRRRERHGIDQRLCTSRATRFRPRHCSTATR